MTAAEANPFWETVRPTFIENWDSRLFNASIVTRLWPLDPRHAAGLRDIWLCVNGEGVPDEHALNDLRALIDQRLREFPGGAAFVRLGSRSPKDVWGVADRQPVRGGHEAVSLLGESERVYDDVNFAGAMGYTPHLVLREFVTIEPWQEWRCFVKGRALRGVSQYFYDRPLPNHGFPESTTVGPLAWAVGQKVAEIAPLLPADDTVVDVIVKYRELDRITSMWDVRLLEINPWSPFTDSCLFNWSRDTFDRNEARWVGDDGQVRTEVLP